MENKSIKLKWVLIILFLFFTLAEIRLVKMQLDYDEGIDVASDAISSGKFSPIEKFEAEISIYKKVIDDISETTIYLLVILIVFSIVLFLRAKRP